MDVDVSAAVNNSVKLWRMAGSLPQLTGLQTRLCDWELAIEQLVGWCESMGFVVWCEL